MAMGGWYNGYRVSPELIRQAGGGAWSEAGKQLTNLSETWKQDKLRQKQMGLLDLQAEAQKWENSQNQKWGDKEREANYNSVIFNNQDQQIKNAYTPRLLESNLYGSNLDNQRKQQENRILNNYGMLQAQADLEKAQAEARNASSGVNNGLADFMFKEQYKNQNRQNENEYKRYLDLIANNSDNWADIQKYKDPNIRLQAMQDFFNPINAGKIGEYDDGWNLIGANDPESYTPLGNYELSPEVMRRLGVDLRALQQQAQQAQQTQQQATQIKQEQLQKALQRIYKD